jgi:hypothetical protein
MLVAHRGRRGEHTFVSGEATILHADLDAFYASVEQRDDPRLRGRPVLVGGGVVLAASYEAKALGIRTAMNGRQAHSLCPWAVVVEPRFSAYVEASKAVFEVFENTTPLVEGLSIDEAFLDVGGLRRVSGTPREIASRLRREVLERVGLRITVGVARTKFLAKVASGVAKPDGLLLVPPDRELAAQRHHQEPVRLGHAAGHLGQELGPGDADRERQADLLAYLAPELRRDRRRRACDQLHPPHVQERLVDRQALDQRRGEREDVEDSLARSGVCVESGFDDRCAGTEAKCPVDPNRRPDSEGAGLVAGRQDDSRTNEDRLTAQAGLVPLLH